MLAVVTCPSKTIKKKVHIDLDLLCFIYCTVTDKDQVPIVISLIYSVLVKGIVGETSATFILNYGQFYSTY